MKPLTPAELIAAELKKIGDGMTMLLNSGLRPRALLVLLSHSTGLSQRDIGLVLNGLENLAKDWTQS